MRRIVLGIVLALVLPGCGIFSEVQGPGTPECGPFGVSVSGVTILQAQAVPTAEWGPCINELKVGWEFASPEVKSGRATFWLDSDRMGPRFVAVSLLDSCDVGAASSARDPFDEVERFVDVRAESGPVEIAVVPVAPRHESNAANVAAALIGQQIEERSVVATVTESGSASREIQEALANGLPTIIIDDREVDSGTLELRRIGREPMVGLSLADVLDEIEDDVDEPEYEATWFHTFEGGCIVYEFHASGFGAETVDDDIDDALGLFPLGALRDAARDAGFDI